MLISWVSNNNKVNQQAIGLFKHICEINGWFVGQFPENAVILFEPASKNNGDSYYHKKPVIRIEEAKIDKFSGLLSCKDTSSPEIEPAPVNKPYIDLWALELKQKVTELVRNKKIPFISKLPWPDGASLAWSLTHDVDLARKYGFGHVIQFVAKGDLRTAGKILRKLYHRDNPYWNFGELLELYRSRQWQVSFFFLVKSWEKSSFRYNIKTSRFRNLFKTILSEGHEIGLHGSRFIFDRPAVYLSEKRKLESLLGWEVKGVRQHYLRILFPEGWHYLRSAGFHYDSSCGYNEAVGFRAGTTFPIEINFPDKSEDDKFYEVPISLMDYPWINPQASFEENWSEFENQIDLIRKTKGLANILWHPHNVAESIYRDYWEKMIAWFGEERFYQGSLSNIVEWWKKRSAVKLIQLSAVEECFRFELESKYRIENLTLEIFSPKVLNPVQKVGKLVENENNTYYLRLASLLPGKTRFELSYK
jgi:peptidoglycan/xylan/chitin deacetylase (PgdA/CDA1 family)